MDADLQVVALIGRGQFGKVYLAQLRREQWVAVKFLHVVNDASRAEQVLMERFNCRILDAHSIPNVIEYIGFVDDLGNNQRGLVFNLCGDISRIKEEAEKAVENFTSVRFVNFDTVPDWSELVPTSLRSMVVHPAKKRWGALDVIGMLRKVATALLEVHKYGFIHRDIADRNILCDERRNVKLADFGLAYCFGYDDTDDEEIGDPIFEYKKSLTPGHHYAVAWWAPECIGDKFAAVFSTQSDIYALGIVMWQCFAHRDPFDDVEPKSLSKKHIEEAAREIMCRIQNDEKPDVGRLDRDTPKRLQILMQNCWVSDPDDRPMLSEIEDELQDIIDELQSIKPRRQPRVRSSSEISTKKWFDVAKMYWELPRTVKQVRDDATNITSPVSFSARRLMQMLREVGHEESPSFQLDVDMVEATFHGRRPYDGFFVHTGAQKAAAVSDMWDRYTSCGFNCFIDGLMNTSDGSNTETMSRSLETCRFAIVIISKEFLMETAPCQELMYAFQRMQWIRQQPFKWESLWVVLYDITVDDYKKAMERDRNLPDLCSSVVLREWSSKEKKWWSTLFHEMKADMVHHDTSHGAVEKWRSFLNQWDSLKCPRADYAYTGWSNKHRHSELANSG